jgi:diadenylate cyclase
LLTRFVQQWSQVSVVSIIDILIIAVLIYQCLVLVKGTRASQILVGVGVLALAFYLARLGGLTTVDWLLSTVLPYAAFAFVVVFQNEIRQALAKLGRRLTGSHGVAAHEAEQYDDIVLAADLFSQNNTGALIVVERDIGLRSHVESGVRLDAYLSYDLLATVFRPSAPLHDGAVIVQKDRIAAAACFLPLSMNPVLSTQLGTRHRAGIGITEETDALAVIVSEETGAISLAVAGKIELDITADQLRSRLSELLHRNLPPAALPTPIAPEAALQADRDFLSRAKGGLPAPASIDSFPADVPDAPAYPPGRPGAAPKRAEYAPKSSMTPDVEP